MQEMIRDAVRRGAPTMHYVITDGSPNGGARDIKMIERLLLNERGDPAQHPVTFLSCSNNPRDVEVCGSYTLEDAICLYIEYRISPMPWQRIRSKYCIFRQVLPYHILYRVVSTYYVCVLRKLECTCVS